ncbi:hypothetical protein [Arthrobacter sp. 2MCAF14]|uniref:hypothetical protein n=1 Tax=Arthrobacter sp. 2MCAF14 TaxID=3232982 RepID=UPI003F907E02
MNTAVTRSILTGALAACLIFASPLAAGAAVLASAPSSTQYDGAPIPSSIADLTMHATTLQDVFLNTEPSSGLDVMLKSSVHAVGSPGLVRVSPPFTANDESWVAVEVPAEAHGTDRAKSALADPGVAYVRALSVTYSAPAPVASKAPNVVNPVQPSSQPTTPGPSPVATPSATATPTAAPSATATPPGIAAHPAPVRDTVPQPNWLAAGGSVLMGGLFIVPLYRLKRSGA